MRLIQVGLGQFGRSWATHAATTPGVTLAAVVDASPASRLWATETLAMPNGTVFESLASALAAVPAEAVLVATPPDTHRLLCETALAAGRHVLCEKPLAPTLADAYALADTADAAGRLLVASQNYRFRPAPRAVARLLAEEAIGTLLHMAVRCLRDTRSLWKPGEFRATMRHPYLRDMAIHHFDLLRLLTGQEPRSVFCHSWPAPDTPFLHHPSVACMLELSGGATMLYEGDWATTGPETSWNGDWELLGSEGRIVWRGDAADALLGTVTLQRWGQQPQEVAQPLLPALDRRGVLVALAEAISSGTIPETNARDNIHSLSLVEAAVLSAESGQVVALPLA